MILEPILKHFDPSKEITIETDGSHYAIRAICSQPDDANILHTLRYYSQKLNSAELNYDIDDKELLVTGGQGVGSESRELAVGRSWDLGSGDGWGAVATRRRARCGGQRDFSRFEQGCGWNGSLARQGKGVDLAWLARQGWTRTGGSARLDRGGRRLEIRDRERT
jgi:acid stress-induced BolA-like protein IbaG/YrbA